MMARSRLPIGIQTFREISEEGSHYADKTASYTEADLDSVFAAELQGLDRDAVRDWYNGYSWRGDERVYNPFDILLLLRSREFRAHWFETGTPRFLIDKLLGAHRDTATRAHGRLAPRFAGRVYLFEFKVQEQAGEGAALAQLRERRRQVPPHRRPHPPRRRRVQRQRPERRRIRRASRLTASAPFLRWAPRSPRS